MSITRDTNIIEAVQKYPQIIEIFQDYGLGCVGCMASHFETIGEGAGAHGIDVDALIADLNDCIKEGYFSDSTPKGEHSVRLFLFFFSVFV